METVTAKTDYNLYNLGVCLRSYKNAVSSIGKAVIALDREGVLEGAEDLDEHLYHFVGVEDIQDLKVILKEFIKNTYPTLVSLFPEKNARHEAIETLMELIQEDIEKTLLAEFPEDIVKDPIFRMGYERM